MVLTVKELAKLADMCRKKGIESIKITTDAVEFKLGEQVLPKRRSRTQEDNKPPVTETMSDEELLFWSSAGIPEVPNA